jgi:peptidoglycan/LPS O-acetylase OafA/YrhL
LLDFGRSGDQGVQLFLIVSGFGLTWALPQSKGGATPGWGGFYRRRLSRIYPEYWMAHLMVLAGALAAGRALQSDASFLFSLLGIRVTPDLLYSLWPSWWYIGLILQLYAVYPLLWSLLRQLGWVRFLLVTLSVSLAIRTIGLWVFADIVPEWDYLDAWARGAVFVTRLPEFAFGMALAAWARNSPDSWMARSRSGGMLTLAATGYVVATALSAYLLGNGIAIFLLGACLFVLLLALFESTLVHWPAPMRMARWLSDHTYSIFLVHYAVIAALILRGAPLDARLALRTGIAIVAIVAAALLLEFLTARARRLAAAVAWQPRRWQLAGGAAVVWLLLIGGELWVRANDPQEVNGWGGRPSLEPHPTIGWRLIPNQITRLRWLGYDYESAANALGFPGPLYPAKRAPGSLRIMTAGDAFTSAEGVDAPKAWPRLLEGAFTRRLGGRLVEVQNFGVTGYGPNQYAAVAEEFVPTFSPDMLVMTMFVDEFDDVATSNEAFRRSIGFGRTGADSLYAVLTLGHLTTLASSGAVKLAFERVLGKPDPADANFAQLNAFRAGRGPDVAANRAMLRDRLERVRRIAEANGARLLLLLVPANIQACAPADLDVHPGNVDLNDRGQFDLERPQRVLAETAATLAIEALDLRPVLAQAGRCLYQPRNMHWLPEAHERVANFVADLLAGEEQLRTLSPAPADRVAPDRRGKRADRRETPRISYTYEKAR